MQINNLPPSQVTEAKPAVAAAPVAPPLKPAVKPVAPKAPEAKAPEANKAEGGAPKAEITDVKPTGTETAEGDQIFTLKVNGKEIKATQAQIVALAQKAGGADAAMQKAAELEKLTADFLDNFDKDVYGIMVKRFGPEKAKEQAVAMIKRLMAEEDKDPKDRENERLKAENEEYKAAQARAKQEQEEAQRKAKQSEGFKMMLHEIDKELSLTILPKDKLTLTRVLNFLAAGKKANGTLWSVKDAVQAVEIEDMGHASYYAKQYVDGKLPSEKFRAILGEDAFKKLNKEQINILKNADKIAKTDAPKVDPGTGEAVARRPRSLSKAKGSDGMSEREWRRRRTVSLGGI